MNPEAENPTPPLQSNDDGRKRLDVLAVTAVSAWIAVPEEWRDRFVSMTANGAVVGVAFSFAAAPTADLAARSTVASNAITARSANAVLPIADGATRHFDLRKIRRATPGTAGLKFCWVGAANASLTVEVSSGPVD